MEAPAPPETDPAGCSSQGSQGLHGLDYHHPQVVREKGSPFFMPAKSLLGAGALEGAVDEIKSLGLKKALIVTDAVLVKVGATEALTDLLRAEGIEFIVYDGTEPNPTIEQVEAGVKMGTEGGCDFLIAFGGGSPNDCAKAIGAVMANGGSIRDYEGIDKMDKDIMPLVAVNTTAGTAAEMTRFAIITDTERRVKMVIGDAKITPTLAVNDPKLMIGMPKGLTAATGMDALTHAIEAYVSIGSTPVTDANALHAIRLICKYLVPAVEDGKDEKARDMMAYAEFLAGMAFNSAGLGYVHAMAHQLGGFYDAPHGVCNAVLLPVVQEYNAKYVPALFIDIAAAMGSTDKGDDQEKAVAYVLKAIRDLNSKVGIPKSLKNLRARPEDFAAMAENAMKDACGKANPHQPTKDEIIALFQQAYDAPDP